MKKDYAIWMLPSRHEMRFMGSHYFEDFDKVFSFADYKKVYEGCLEVEDASQVVDKVFHILNVEHPADYRNPSLSVSDIVEVDGKFFFCDSFGWKEVNNK